MKTRQVTVADVLSVSYPENVRPNGKVEGLEFDMAQTKHLLHSILSRLDTAQLMAIYEDMHGSDEVPVDYDAYHNYPFPESERLIP